MDKSIDRIIVENARRNIDFHRIYDPSTGEGSTAIERVLCTISDYDDGEKPKSLYLPKEMLEKHKGVRDLLSCGSFRKFIAKSDGIDPKLVTKESIDAEIIEFCKLRIRYDFEYWAYAIVRIKDKTTGQDVPFRLNYPQRNILLKALEAQRIAGKPIRLILLKARQWGGSTLVQIYMLWIQTEIKKGWNSVIAAHKKSGSRTIKGMVSKALKYYPDFLGKYDFHRWENSTSTSIIEGRNNKITIGTAQVPDSVRSEDIVMAHLSEVAYWQSAEMIKPEDLIASIVGSILRVPYSLVVMESTANGVGNFFHKEWIKAEKGESDKVPVFVAWWQVELYREEVKDIRKEVAQWGEQEWELWNIGASVEAIAWWRGKSKELSGAGIEKMHAEYPSTPLEAFVSTGMRVFSPTQCNDMRSTCMEPRWRGELQGDESEGKACIKHLEFNSSPNGLLQIWKKPEREPLISNRYLVVVDIGGRSERADYSVIAVFDRSNRIGGGRDEIVAQWVGHIDHDLLCWKAVQIAQWYCKALLVVESNTLDRESDTDGDHTQFILEKVGGVYSNLYARSDPDKVREGVPVRYGFHTNRATKTAVIDNEIRMYRTQGYIERSEAAVDEHEVYEKKNNGVFAAKLGHHDDLLMTRAIGSYVSDNMPVPKVAMRSKLLDALGIRGNRQGGMSRF